MKLMGKKLSASSHYPRKKCKDMAVVDTAAAVAEATGVTVAVEATEDMAVAEATVVVTAVAVMGAVRISFS